MEYPRIKLQVGDMMQLQSLKDDNRYYVRVIGYLLGRSLLVTTPTINDKIMLIREGQHYAVRLMSGNSVVGFNTSVRQSCMRPYPYLHLEYPETIEEVVVRRAQRVRANLVASVKNEKLDDPSGQPAVVVDLSTAGAGLLSAHVLGSLGDPITLILSLSVGEVQKILIIQGLLRSIRDADHEEHVEQRYSYGVEFQFVDQEDLVMLHGYVYEQLAQK